MSDFSHISGARENEQFADSLNPSEDNHRNWIVIVRFYSFLHYVEERLESEGYNSKKHAERMENIRRCPSIDNKAYNIYRTLYDLSRDSRYECIRMGDSEVNESENRLEDGKEVLGFTNNGSSHKYSTS